MKVKFSQTQRIFIIEQYFSAISFVKLIEAFKETDPNAPDLKKTTIYCLATEFHETGIVHKKKRSDRPFVLSSDKI